MLALQFSPPCGWTKSSVLEFLAPRGRTAYLWLLGVFGFPAKKILTKQQVLRDYFRNPCISPFLHRFF